MSIKINDIIVALATPNNPSGAIAVIRVSGENCISFVNRFVSIDLLSKKDHTINFCKIFDEGENIIDEVLISIFFKNHSYTKEESIEISCHNSQYIIKAILELFIKHGARMADHGEFTQRAFLNGQFDLTQAEAVADIISAKTKSAHDIAFNQLNGKFSQIIKNIKEDILELSSHLELDIDFSQEQMSDFEITNNDYTTKVEDIILKIKKLLENFKNGEIIKKGLPIAIIGKPNVGKSSLLNALANEERAIVSSIAGTTRDTIDIEIDINGISCRFIDTAGLRDNPNDEIEKIGIIRSKKTIEKAQLVIFMIDTSMNAEDYKKDLEHIKNSGKDVVFVVNKIDLNKNYKSDIENTIYISVKNNINIEAIKTFISEKYQIHEEEIVINLRHYDILTKLLQIFLKLKENFLKNISNDILMIDMNEAIALLNTITGETTSNEILNNIFKHFCIGK